MIHILYCDDPWFTKLQQGIKKVEGRKGVPKYRKIQAGDQIAFVCEDRKFVADVVKVDVFKTLDDYLNTVGVSNALPGYTTLEEGRKIYYQWSTPEEIEKYGFLAIWISF